jgi:hypothetical protein
MYQSTKEASKLCFPLCCTMNFMGLKLVALTVLPVGKETLCYGNERRKFLFCFVLFCFFFFFVCCFVSFRFVLFNVCLNCCNIKQDLTMLVRRNER